MSIETELDRLLDEADHREKQQRRRRNIGRGVFEGHRDRQLAAGNLHPLRRKRLTFRDGITVDELSERSTVSKSVINDIEGGKAGGSDVTWRRLCLALGGCRRAEIDPRWIWSS